MTVGLLYVNYQNERIEGVGAKRTGKEGGKEGRREWLKGVRVVTARFLDSFETTVQFVL